MSLDGFKKSLEEYAPGAGLSGQEASEAMHNLTGFMSLLIKINEREKVVSTHENK